MTKPEDAAAAEFWDLLDVVEQHKPMARRMAAAEKTLKGHMIRTGVSEFRGIRLEESPAGDRLNLAMLKARFGDVVDECRKPSVAQRLVPFRRPRSRKRSDVAE